MLGHLDCYVGSMDDRHELQEERPPKDTIVPDVKTSNLERQHLPTLVLPYPTRYLQVDAPYGSGRLPCDDPMERVMYRGQI
jgi:hypothetical protein